MQHLALDRALELADRYPRKSLVDELIIVRGENDNEDFLTRSATGRFKLVIDDVAALIRYVELRSAGYPVKLAGKLATTLRAAMREHPEADQLVTVTLENGFQFTLPADTVDLTSGYNSGGYVASATIVDCRNIRARIQRAIDAYESGIEVEHEAA
jgi:hypothetical protein